MNQVLFVQARLTVLATLGVRNIGEETVVSEQASSYWTVSGAHLGGTSPQQSAHRTSTISTTSRRDA